MSHHRPPSTTPLHVGQVPIRSATSAAVITTEKDFACSGSVIARLTEAVHRLRASWLAGPALLWSDIYSIDKCAGGYLEYR